LIVAGQSATALACRSSRRAGYAVSLRTNPRVVVALLIMWMIAAGLLFVPGLARLLGQRAPTGIGLAVALLAFPAVQLGDATAKAIGRWRASAPC